MRGSLASRLAVALALSFAHGFAGAIPISRSLGLGDVFRLAMAANPPSNDYNQSRTAHYNRCADQHHYRQHRHACPSGKQHGFAPPARPAKKKGHLRSPGSFY